MVCAAPGALMFDIRLLLASMRAPLMLALLALHAVSAVQAEEALTRFHADVRIHADGSLEVLETIALRAEGREIRRGFIREFPTRYRDRVGNRVSVGFEMLNATRNGNPEPFWTENVSNGVEIFLGDDSYLDIPQVHTYTLRYRTTHQLGHFEDFDELYWNVTGTGWIFPIEASSANVRLPEALPAESLRMACYTGYQDSDGRSCRFEVLEPGLVRFETTRKLSPNEGLTIAVGFPKGTVAEPTRAAKAARLLKDNSGLLVAVAGLLALLIWYLLQWNSKGRDPSPGVIFPRYQPPEGHSPAGIRYLRRMGWDNRCFSADLVDAGVRGFLTIHRDKPTAEMMLAAMPEKQRAAVANSKLARRMLDMSLKMGKEMWRLERVATASESVLTESQRGMINRIFAAGPQVTLQNSNPATVSAMQSARSAQQIALDSQYKPRYFVGNGGVVGWGFLISLVYLALGFTLSARSGGIGMPLIIGIAMLSVIMHIVMANLMKQPTAEGRRLLDEIEGLRVYLGLAEKSDIGRLEGPANEPALDADRYEQLLPYALALDVEDAWTKKFTLAAAAAGAVAAATGATRWYQGNLAQVSNLGDMSKSLGSALSTQIASSSSPPGSSSGSGGGGRSGGGGGGGGGRGR